MRLEAWNLVLEIHTERSLTLVAVMQLQHESNLTHPSPVTNSLTDMQTDRYR